MKKTIVTFLASFVLYSVSFAQSIDDIKNLIMINQFAQAKTGLDKAMANAKFNSKPEAYMQKTTVYAALAMDEANKNKPTGDQLIADANAAFAKYKEMDKSMALVTDQFYQNGVINLYSYYYGAGYQNYNDKKPTVAFENLNKAFEFSNLLIEKKILTTSLDTNLHVLAGITAEQSENKDAALFHYTKLANAKVAGDDFESIYRFLVSQYFAKKDFSNFDKYKTLGAELYPKSEFFAFDKIDFAVGLEPEFSKKVAMLKEVLASDPNNYKANQVLGEIIYSAINPDNEDDQIPADASELETTMIAAFQKAAIAKPDDELAFLYIGDHAIKKAAKIGELRTAHAKDMQARTKPGTKSSPEDIKKRDELDKIYSETLDGAREPYEKVAAIFAAKEKLDGKDKQQYRKVAGYLGDIYKNKLQIATKAKAAAEIAKYTAEEKKWNDKYDSIK